MGEEQRLSFWYRRVQPVLVAVTALLVVVSLVGLVVLDRVGNAREHQRLKDQAQNSACILSVVKQLAGNGPPVRKATQKRDAATRSIVLDLYEVVRLASAGQKATPALKLKFASDLGSYLADDNGVKAARKANPYPSSPGGLCGLTDKAN